MAWRAVLAGFRVREVPITFTERQRGSSKMDTAIVVEAFWRVACWGAGRLLRRTPEVLRAKRPSGTAGDEAVSDGPVRT
jgi:dolichol-phosphate mannosyltransferase